MHNTIVIIGSGPGVSRAVAERFAAAGFSVALVARNRASLDDAVATLRARGARAAGYVGDAADSEAVRSVVGRARDELGPIGVLHWNAYSNGDVGELLVAAPRQVAEVFDIAIVGLLAAIQESLPDLRAAGNGTVLVTNGAFGDLSPAVDQFATSLRSVGLALANAAKHKLVGLLAVALAQAGVHIGEVTIAGAVNGTPAAPNGGGIDAADVAAAFWNLYQLRTEHYARIAAPSEDR
jgi:NAD(P)-dependent dehydrogenase (short-subunit alcohol dehydrogenase family)